MSVSCPQKIFCNHYVALMLKEYTWSFSVYYTCEHVTTHVKMSLSHVEVTVNVRLACFWYLIRQAAKKYLYFFSLQNVKIFDLHKRYPVNLKYCKCIYGYFFYFHGSGQRSAQTDQICWAMKLWNHAFNLCSRARAWQSSTVPLDHGFASTCCRCWDLSEYALTRCKDNYRIVLWL